MASLGLGSDHAVAGFLVFSAVHLTMPSSAQGDVNTNNHELCNIAPESSQEHTRIQYSHQLLGIMQTCFLPNRIFVRLQQIPAHGGQGR